VKNPNLTYYQLNHNDAFHYRFPSNPKPQGKDFDGSSILFETQQLLKNIVGNAIWLTDFKPINQEPLNL
jgi:hypothetical protein